MPSVECQTDFDDWRIVKMPSKEDWVVSIGERMVGMFPWITKQQMGRVEKGIRVKHFLNPIKKKHVIAHKDNKKLVNIKKRISAKMSSHIKKSTGERPPLNSRSKTCMYNMWDFEEFGDEIILEVVTQKADEFC